MSGIDEPCNVARDDLRQVDAPRNLHDLEKLVAREHGGDGGLGAELPLENDALDDIHGASRHFELEEKSVELRLRQRIGAFELDGILRREHEKRRGQWMDFSHHRHLPLLHCFEKRRLGLGRGPVDLVRQYQIPEEWTGPEHEALLAVPLSDFW